MELLLVMGISVVLIFASFLLGEHLQERRMLREAGRVRHQRAMCCVQFAAQGIDTLIRKDMMEAGKRTACIEELARTAFVYSFAQLDPYIEEEIHKAVNGLT
ncbi:hypothetical protein EDD70_2039 [Hydrogenoanaerobacterium saccharovorans]|uniref:Bacteriophage holin of superfamily 6 (Holin_LLH) n=1 Tax=Hydrogenoanaerobacterium saccharovorans TaxID=474960 RepID=A0A1H8CFZ7_9FIRM|nr:hypothetical protein [Hydrogenoanaerobacterium saccharovorans]RPF43081.1 hypothetical protein EDD70_2039 [Hydrogenoanaerobacterium saccharovorans]SEM93910.1 hypothetical protein SAMN05216180_2097 [Hydrogenoanaerobacterium saccharovorans]